MVDLSVPITVTPATGRVNTPPTQLLANLIAAVAAVNPGYTATLPGSLIRDIATTDVGALTDIDQALTDLINSITPYAANPYLLNQLGQIYGIVQGLNTNTSVYVVFSGTVGFSIPAGFIVSDGTYQYAVQEGAIVGSGGTTPTVYCLATTAGTWAVPAGSVTTLITSKPSGITLTVTNPLAGTPSPGAQSEWDYRAQVLAAGLATATGAPTFTKSLITQVAGVQPRLVSIQQQSPGWKIIVGGGDPYQVANAIFQGMDDISNLQSSVIQVTGVTAANPFVVTTNLNHGFMTGQANVRIAGVVGMGGVNGGPYVVTVITPTTFSVASLATGSYTSGGVVTPNARNATANVIDYPDTYTINFVGNPPQQTVTIALTWNTSAPFAVSSAAVAQLGAPALAAYVNSIAVGDPMNLFELQNTFQAAVVSVVPTNLLTRMLFTVDINGIAVSPTSGTGIIAGDPESYFSCVANGVTITQG